MQTLMVKSGRRYRKATAAEVAEVAGENALLNLNRAKPYLGNLQVVVPFLREMYAGRDYESFTVLFADARLRLIAATEMFRGTIAQSSVYPREVAKECLWRGAAAVICAHNHPSGFADPSTADVQITNVLREALGLFEVRLLDHVILGAGTYFSFREDGLI